jgi:hypothetical protein
MTRRDFPLPCNRCRKELTRSVTGLCLQCRPAPEVEIVGDMLVVGGGYALPTDKAIILAHRILDALTPSFEKEK